jgi:hypothetical protein
MNSSTSLADVYVVSASPRSRKPIWKAAGHCGKIFHALLHNAARLTKSHSYEGSGTEDSIVVDTALKDGLVLLNRPAKQQTKKPAGKPVGNMVQPSLPTAGSHHSPDDPSPTWWRSMLRASGRRRRPLTDYDRFMDLYEKAEEALRRWASANNLSHRETHFDLLEAENDAFLRRQRDWDRRDGHRQPPWSPTVAMATNARGHYAFATPDQERYRSSFNAARRHDLVRDDLAWRALTPSSRRRRNNGHRVGQKTNKGD